MSELDNRQNADDWALRNGVIRQCRWHGYYDIKVGCDKCRKEEAKQKQEERKRRPSGIFDNVVWLEK